MFICSSEASCMHCPFVSSSASSRVENCYSFTVRLMMSRWQEISRLPSRNTNARLQRVVPTTTPTDGRARSKQAPFVPANQIHSNCSSLEKASFVYYLRISLAAVTSSLPSLVKQSRQVLTVAYSGRSSSRDNAILRAAGCRRAPRIGIYIL